MQRAPRVHALREASHLTTPPERLNPLLALLPQLIAGVRRLCDGNMPAQTLAPLEKRSQLCSHAPGQVFERFKRRRANDGGGVRRKCWMSSQGQSLCWLLCRSAAATAAAAVVWDE